jgi:hypothetical protein
MLETVITASAARTASGVGTPVSTLNGQESPKGPARFFLKVTAISGAGATITGILKGIVNGVVVNLVTFAAITTVSDQTLLVDGCPDDVQLDYTIAGTTPSITFEAHCVRG